MTIEPMLTPFRRHTPKCPHRSKGRKHFKCRCPIHADGTLSGKRVRISLKTRDWNRACRRVTQMEAQEGTPRKEISAAVQSFLEQQQLNGREPGTVRNNRRVLGNLVSLTKELRVHQVHEVTLELLEQYPARRDIQASTWTKEREILVHFFGYCVEHDWARANLASRLERPQLKPKPKEPYTEDEVRRILDACDSFGRGPYERARARAMVLLMRNTALRIGDVALLRRDRLRDQEIYLHAMKNGRPIRLPVPADLDQALRDLPAPRGATGDSEYFFWSGNGSTKAAIRDVTRTLGRVFKLSGVRDAHAHRFRHTLATELLGDGGTAEDVGSILGISPAVVLRHYAQWSIKRQEQINSLLQRVRSSGTDPAQA